MYVDSVAHQKSDNIGQCTDLVESFVVVQVRGLYPGLFPKGNKGYILSVSFCVSVKPTWSPLDVRFVSIVYPCLFLSTGARGKRLREPRIHWLVNGKISQILKGKLVVRSKINFTPIVHGRLEAVNSEPLFGKQQRGTLRFCVCDSSRFWLGARWRQRLHRCTATASYNC